MKYLLALNINPALMPKFAAKYKKIKNGTI